MMTSSALPVLIFAIPFLVSLLIPAVYKKKMLCLYLAGGALLISFYFSVQGLLAVRGGATLFHRMGGWLPPYGIEWRLDALSALLCLLITGIAFAVLVATQHSVRKNLWQGAIPFYTTALLNISGLLGILMTHDFFNLFVFLEISSLTTYALVATGDRYRGNLASLRYLLIGTIGASFYLLGVGYLYAVTGTLNMSDMAARLPVMSHSHLTLLALFLIFIGVAIKMGLFPFHGWLPDAYAYASNPASALIAPISTKVSIYVLIRIFIDVVGTDKMTAIGLDSLLIGLGAAGILFGSFMAFGQKELKRMLAYSSISHIGLITVGLAINHPVAFVGAVLHIIFHALMKASFFLIADSVDEKHKINRIEEFVNLKGRMPNTMRACAITALSMIGIPPLCGFFSKWYILVGAAKSGHLWVAVFIALSSLLTALYFFKLIEKTFFYKESQADIYSGEGSSILAISYGLLSVGLLALGILAPKLFGWCYQVLIATVI